ncbi:MAG: SUMF1/EgtB/PvdO family nonheme iron enzyme, partial [Planctomycetota bacterium]
TVGVVVVAGAGIAMWLRPLREAPATETAWLEPDPAERPFERSTSDPPDDIPTVGGEAGTSPAPVVPPVTEAEPEPAPTPVDLGPIERQVEMTAAEAGDLEFRTNPAVRDAIEEGRRRVEEARTLGDEGDTGEAARVYELAMSAYLQALARDTLAATVETLGDEVALRLAAVEVPAHPILIEVRDDVLSLDADGAAAFTAGELERAEEQWRAARMQINALERLAVPADAALSARAEWTQVFEARPDGVDAGLAGAIDALAASTRLADGLLVDGQFEQAEAAWRQATGDLRILLERHETALTSASGCAEAWRAAGGRAPTTWIDDPTVATARRDAEQLASGAQQAFGEARYDEACDRWSRAARRLDDATAAHAEAIETLLAGAGAARQAGAFDEALARLDLVAPFVDEETVRTARIATLVARVQARARPDTRDEARAALTALLAVDPEHPDAADLERRVDALFGPHHGDRRSNGLGRTFVYLAPGVFTMGSPADEPGRGPLETAHRVRLTRGTWMGATEVTRAEFAAFVDDTGHVTDAEREGWAFGLGPDGAWGRRDGLSWRDPGFEQDDDHPVVCVSHADAVAFCAWLSRREGRAYRLPTEAEWEYACRAGAGTAYAWGDAADDAEGFANVADFSAADRLTRVERFGFFDGHVFTSAAASFEPNGWGLHDMHGNVAEWCGDRYARLAAEETVDPTGPSGDASNDRAPRVLRGGSFAAPPAHCRSAHRDASAPDTRFATHGFRVVCEDAPGS